ncbi:Hypothetical predicted protein [Argonauta hians]
MLQTSLERYFREWRPLIGEIAYQLDEQICQYAISGLHGDLYQFTDVMSLIRLIYHNNDDMCKYFGSSVIRRVFIRLMEVIFLLRKHGYSVDIHGPFARYMVSKYGRPSSRTHFTIARLCARHDPDHLRFLINDLAENTQEKTNVLILSDCLNTLIAWRKRNNIGDKEKLFVEIAYQLDNRILKLVTNRILEKYSATTVQEFVDTLQQNRSYLIEGNTSGSFMTKNLIIRIVRRFLRIFLYFQKHGYVFEQHATYSKNLIQNYDRQFDSNYCDMLNWCTEEDSSIIKSLFNDLADNEREARNIHVLFDCLKSLAEFYDCSVFSY